MVDRELFGNLNDEQREALVVMVEGWIGEGFTTPPYTAAQYDIFEGLGLQNDEGRLYDIDRRP